MAVTTTGVPINSVGMTYDLAIGPNPVTGNAGMMGYMLAPGTEWTEVTDTQDDEHLVQIASAAASDKFFRYPKISQGDWSGGERQLLFTDNTRYYQSRKLETAAPGHLRILGQYKTITIPGTVGQPTTAPGGVALDPSNSLAWFATGGGFTNNEFSTDLTSGTTVAGRIGALFGGNAVAINEILAGPDQVYFAVSAQGIFNEQGANGTLIQTAGDTPRSSPTGRAMAFIPGFVNDAIVYWHSATPDLLYQLVATTAGYSTPVAPSQILALPANEGVGYLVAPLFPIGYVIVIGAITTPVSKVNPPMFVYSWDGTSAAPSLLAILFGYAVDLRQVGGTTYLLTATTGELNTGGGVPVPQPQIYSINGSQVQLFDDYRYLPPAFQAVATSSGGQFGRIDGDVNQLYMSWPTIGVKRYDVTSGAVYNVGDDVNQASGAIFRNVAVGPSGSFVEYGGDTGGIATYCIWGTKIVNNDTGYLITSWFDAGVPGIMKSWKQLEIEMNAPATWTNAVTVTYLLDNSSTVHTLNMVRDAQNNFVGIHPAGIRAKRIQYTITLQASSSGVSPDIRSTAVYATMGRVWKGTVRCYTNQQTHAGDDAQGVPVDPSTGLVYTAFNNVSSLSDALIVNIMNLYQTGGKAVLFVPDPTASGGVSQVNAILQDYTRRTKSPPGPRQDEFIPTSQEAEIDLMFTEDL